MKIAIVGSGISGLLSARLLCGDHEVTVFEANGYAGGHTRVAIHGGSGKREGRACFLK